ncbi:4-hydroxy-tetrahydrodipicolinate synthase [Alicyclobacillaceae bacterium I2511]|nr:4-hydroxy-tetrahydrodipicolinate synthase [Alicyclobacillaceae bacterium I2511]
MSFILKGVYAPIPTPFINGEIAYAELKKNMQFWLNSRLEGLVVLGSNGEFVALNSTEKMDLISFVIENVKGQKPVIAGTGAESTVETIRLSKQAAMAGVKAVLVVTPHYYKSAMSDKTLEKFYLDIAEASTVPVILYNIPRNTGVNLSSTLVSKLALHPNIIGIKDSGGNITQISEIIHNTSPDFSVFAGSASYFYVSLMMGAKGGTLALANVFPDECVQIQELFQAGKLEEAKNIQLRLLESNEALTTKWGIAGVKGALDIIGYFGGDPRPPLQPLGEMEKEELKRILLRG